MKILKAVQKGFSLIEIMIVVAIIGIIASIALPSYADYVEKGRAAEAPSILADLRIKMEQCFQDTRDYTDVTCAAFCSPGSGDVYFGYSCTPAATATTYTLAAAGVGNMSTFAYSVDESNNKNSTYKSVAGNGCWLSSKGSSC